MLYYSNLQLFGLCNDLLTVAVIMREMNLGFHVHVINAKSN